MTAASQEILSVFEVEEAGLTNRIRSVSKPLLRNAMRCG